MSNKIISDREFIVNLVNHLQDIDKTIVLACGAFDLLHPGHVAFIEQASKLGHLFIVGLYADAYISKTKGIQNPVQTQKDRAVVLGAFEHVRYIVPMGDEESNESIIRQLHPDFYARGGMEGEEPIERTAVEESHGKLMLIPYIEGYSSSHILEVIKQKMV
ncbi:MAG: adenylyltransferase/cytidyltransferase family protein [bacterium]|nr:adenylyltransferase/cytidyltransferase family protein [bacterium]